LYPMSAGSIRRAAILTVPKSCYNQLPNPPRTRTCPSMNTSAKTARNTSRKSSSIKPRKLPVPSAPAGKPRSSSRSSPRPLPAAPRPRPAAVGAAAAVAAAVVTNRPLRFLSTLVPRAMLVLGFVGLRSQKNRRRVPIVQNPRGEWRDVDLPLPPSDGSIHSSSHEREREWRLRRHEPRQRRQFSPFSCTISSSASPQRFDRVQTRSTTYPQDLVST
jgi:hypothetical protein